MALNDQIWMLLAGLGLFLFGMFLLEEGLKKVAGRSFKIFLRNQTDSTFKAISAGALVTALLQSSSLVTLLVMSFAGSGLIGLASGIGMILGANVGTTLTGWLVALVGFKIDINAFVLPFVAIGGLGLAFLKSEKLASFSKMLMGLSLLFMGLNYMKEAFAELTTTFDFDFLIGKPWILFVVFGTILTALIQSSSAAVTIFLSTLSAGIITLDQGAYLVIGANIGSTATGLISMFGANTVKKRVGWAQFYFNVFTAAVALIFSNLILKAIHHFFSDQEDLTALVLFHTAFNLLGVLLVWPFIHQFTYFIERIVPENHVRKSKYLNHLETADSLSGMEALRKEAKIFLEEIRAFNAQTFDDKGWDEPQFLHRYQFLKDYETEISNYIFHLHASEFLTTEAEELTRLSAAIRNASLSTKDLKDSHHNWLNLKELEDESARSIQKQIADNQLHFYTHLAHFMLHPSNATETELEQLDQLQNEFFRMETDLLYKMQQSLEFDLVSGLNMLREINSSNSSLIRSWKHLLA
jgi:phosphate:Na+ symporter